MGDADRILGMLEKGKGEELSTFFRAQRKVDGILHDGILVLTNRRLMWVEESGQPIQGTFEEVVGAASYEVQLALRFRRDWVSLFFPKPQIAADAERQIAGLLKGNKGP